MKALLLILLSGCFVLPKTTTTTRDLGTAPGDVEHGPVQQVELDAKATGDSIVVTAIAERECKRPFVRTIEETKEKHARWSGVKDPRAGLFALVLAPITVPVTAIGTGIAVLADGNGTSTTRTEIVRTETFACKTPIADHAVAIVMPSGATLNGATNGAGIAAVQIPETEPYRGVAKLGEHEIAYARPMPAVTAVRETVYDCATQYNVHGAVRVSLGIDEHGRATSVGLDAGDRDFAACVQRGIQNTQFKQRDVKLVLPLFAAL